MHDLLILGASNEILRVGYAKHLRDWGWRIANWSVGGCGSSAGVYSLLKQRPVRAELALLSYEINDFATLEQGVRSEQEIHENWKWMVFRLRELDIVPVLLILTRSRRGRFFTSAARRLQIAVGPGAGSALR
jgi:hypothetical protein